MNRRTFACRVAAALAGLGLARRASGQITPASLPTRRLGRTELEVPILALGGHHLGLAGSEREARVLVETAL